VLAQLRAEQRDPAHGGRAAQIRGRKNAAHQAAVRDCQGERPDPAVFARETLPGLRSVPIGVLVAATGLSDHYCSLIRLGKKVPHARHWEVLREVARERKEDVPGNDGAGAARAPVSAMDSESGLLDETS
jgi:hypothetical protein